MRRREAILLAVIITIGGLFLALLVGVDPGEGGDEDATAGRATTQPSAALASPPPTATPRRMTPALTSTTAPASPTEIVAYALVYSMARDRSDPQPLAGATISGQIYLFVPHNSFMDQVDFYLDGEFIRQENNSPYDFSGGTEAIAVPWDSGSVADGEHVVGAVIRFDDDSSIEISATFTTANGVLVAPTPTATAISDSGTATASGSSMSPESESRPTVTATPRPPEGSIQLIPTIRSISVYVAYSGSRKSLPIEYRETGDVWRKGHPLWVDDGQARGSLVELEPDTTYDVRVGAVTKSVTTRAERVPFGNGAEIEVSDAAELQAALDSANPGDVIRLAPGEYIGPFTLTRDGLPDSYLSIDGMGAAILTGSAGAVPNVLTLDDADYVRLTGLTVQDAGRNLITLINGSDHVVIEGNRLIEPAYGLDTDLPDVAAAIHLRDGSRDALIRDNVIHRDTTMTAKHSFPAVYAWKAGQGLIITGNTVTGGFEDAFRWGPEDTPEESFSRDVDIYDNHIDGACFDDGIQPEGVGINVRVWGNTITHCYVAMAFAPTIEGPLYVFRNIVVDNVHPVRGGSGIFKLGDEDEGRRGPKYIYHNTLIANAPRGYVTVWKQTNSGVGTVISRNNIVVGSKYVLELGCDLTCDMDYDAIWTTDSSRFLDYRSEKFWNLRTWCATYRNGCHSIRRDARRDLDGSYRPKASSALIDAGVVIPGFNDGYLGAAPDLGAVEVK